MNKKCTAFPSEYKFEYTKIKKLSNKLKPIRPIEHWSIEELVDKYVHDEKSEEILYKFIVDRLRSVYQVAYNKERFEQDKEKDENLDLGNELIAYLKNLYLKEPSEKVLKAPYTSSRVYGYISPQTLRGDFTNYQDTYGRTGGIVMLQNLQRMTAIKRRRMIQAKLRASLNL